MKSLRIRDTRGAGLPEFSFSALIFFLLIFLLFEFLIAGYKYAALQYIVSRQSRFISVGYAQGLIANIDAARSSIRDAAVAAGVRVTPDKIYLYADNKGDFAAVESLCGRRRVRPESIGLPGDFLSVCVRYEYNMLFGALPLHFSARAIIRQESQTL